MFTFSDFNRVYTVLKSSLYYELFLEFSLYKHTKKIARSQILPVFGYLKSLLEDCFEKFDPSHEGVLLGYTVDSSVYSAAGEKFATLRKTHRFSLTLEKSIGIGTRFVGETDRGRYPKNLKIWSTPVDFSFLSGPP